jgi:methylthioribulose-1-phosphate dehydratase
MTDSVPARIAEEIIAAGALVSARGWTPATAGNLSARIDAHSMAITASGVDKGSLRSPDVLAFDFAASKPRRAESPPAAGRERVASAETALHVERYQADAGVGAVVHVHARSATVLSLVTDAREIRLEDYELLKALHGVRTHEIAVSVPIFANTQDMTALARDVRQRLAGAGPSFGYLLAGHGLYAWGATMRDALRHTEALEFLLGCEMDKRKVGR